MKKRIPIGVSDFRNLITENYYYVDKSLFIKDIIEDGAAVILLPRPRRFGKTLNMSMLKYFYEQSEENNIYLFEGLNITKHKEIMNIQGKYPVIYMSFKEVKSTNFKIDYDKMKELISEEYGRHKYLLEGTTLEEHEKDFYNQILNCTAAQARVELSLKYLSKYLYRYFNKKCVILIDEYDVPIQNSYINGYYDEVINFMRNFLSGGLKDNEYLEKSVLTGILRVAKESIFSGLNNLEVYTLTKRFYNKHFGFLDDEVENILKYYEIDFEMDEVRKWYNGYVFGGETIYNPWSILKYVKHWEDGFRAHWVNTSDNKLVKTVLAQGNEKVKKELENLIQGKEISKAINEDIVMEDISKGSENIWSFLLFSGYLKVIHKETKMGKAFCTLKIPNLEVEYLYREIIISWFDENISKYKFNIMLESLLIGDIDTFQGMLNDFVMKSVSYFDVSGDESEKVYHAFVLGMLIALNEDYEVKSNRESGIGRYDVMIIPKDVSKLGIIFEFKKLNIYKKEKLENAADAALKQIEEKNYKQELLDRGIKSIIELGVAFHKKELLIKKKARIVE